MSSVDFKSLGLSLLNQAANILPELLPGGSLVGDKWKCGDAYGNKGNSFTLDIRTGKWKDFADAEAVGSDIIALYAFQQKCSMLEAAQFLREKYLGGVVEPKYSYPVKPTKDPHEIIKPPLDAAKPEFPRNSQHWIYRDEQGDVLFYVVRWQGPDGKKNFYPLCFTTGKQWIKKGWPYRMPLYNLHTLAGSDKPVIIVEGEKAAEACIKFFTAYDVVTWSGGAQAWKKTDWSSLADRKVIIWPDADEPGIATGQALLVQLKEICIQVKLINTDKADGWDAYDCFVHEKWDFNKWAQWAKPLLTSWDRPIAEMEVLEPERKEEAPIEISTDEFPASPNMNHLFNTLDLHRSGNGAIVMNASNVAKLLRNDMKDLVWRDTFYNANMTKWNTGETRVWSDEDSNNLFIKMQLHYGLAKLSKTHVDDAVNFIAAMDKRNEPKDWLNGLVWDGVSRVDKFFHKAMQASDEEWTHTCSKNFWISLAARVLNPGCQVDEMAVFESPQGTRKTSALLAIGGKWYGEVNAELSNKDFDQGLVGKIIVEFGELSAMKNSDIELVKRKITCREDQYRPSYGKRTEKFPRTCIFAGTTNEKNYLKDSTGGRRFNPVAVGNVDVEYIKANRDQLFAEAVARYKNEETWWEYPAEIANEVRESRREADEWENIISSFIGTPPLNTIFLQTKDIWLAMNGSIDKLDRNTQLRIGKCMRKLGYEKKKVRAGSVTEYAWSKT